MKKKNKTTGSCPVCGQEIEIYSDMEKGNIINCYECGSSLEIKLLKPVRFAIVNEYDEDDMDYDYEEDYDYDDDDN